MQPLDAARVDEWEYVDESGNVQGPFTSAQMATWTEYGYFTYEVLVRNVGYMPRGTMLPMGTLFPEPSEHASPQEVEAATPFRSSSSWLPAWRAHVHAAAASR